MVKKELFSAFLLVIGISIGFAADTSFVWSNVSIGGGGYVSGVIASPVDENLFYVRTDVGGAYRWDETNQKWIPLMDWVDEDERGLLGVEALAVDPITSGKVYMVTGTSYWNNGRSAFLRSEDKGASWEVLYTWDSTGFQGAAIQKFKVHGNGMGRGNGEALAIDPNDPDIMFYGSRGNGLFKSTDNGSSWNHVDAFTTVAGCDTTWNGAGFSFVQFAPGSSDVLYAGFLREGTTADGTFENVFTSTDAGATWQVLPIPDSLRTTAGGGVVRLMPQRAAISSDGNLVTITFADGAGPHTMSWDEGWGMINDGFGRGAVLQYNVSTGVWTDISPEDFIDDGSTGTSDYDVTAYDADTYEYIAPYGGITINPENDSEMIVTAMGYRGAQFWFEGTTFTDSLINKSSSWQDAWGTNIYRTTDGGKTWDASFRYYWMEGGYYPSYQEMDDNGIGWMHDESIHWTGSVAMDPFNTDRVWVTSGNGVFRCDNFSDYTVIDSGTYDSTSNYYYSSRTTNQNQVWKVVSQGIEETVPLEAVSIPGGPLISVIGDYDGFRHDDVAQYPSERFQTSVSGNITSLGTTRGLAYAPLSGTLVKVTDARVYEGEYSNIPIDPIQFSSDSGTSWTVATYGSLDTSYKKGDVGISADGSVVLWMPGAGTTTLYRYANAAWSATSLTSVYPVGDQVNADILYAYDYTNGIVYRSLDQGASFTKAGSPGVSSFRKMRAAPGHEGDLWVPIAVDGSTSGALMHSTDSGSTWTAVDNVTYCEAVGFGKSATDGGYPAVYAFATVDGVRGIFQSDDEGATWTRVNDDGHEYGGISDGEFVTGDMNTYGVVYMSSAGRGLVARVPSDWNMGTSSSTASTSISTPSAVTLTGNVSAALQNQTLTLNVSGTAKVHVSVFDLHGRTVFASTYASSASIPLGEHVNSSGAYLLRVRSGNSMLLNKTVTLLR